MLHATSTIAEINAELEAGTCTLADARKVLTPRSKRDSASGRRAQAWLKAHGSKTQAPKAQAQVVTPPARKVGAGSRGGDVGKFARAQYAARLGHAPNTPAWWDAYRSETAKKIAEVVTSKGLTHEQVLASLSR